MGVHVPGQLARATFQDCSTGLFVGSASQAQFGAAAQAGFVKEEAQPRDAVVDGVDHATHRIAAVEQGSRTAQHLDALGHQRICGRGMVEAQRRGIDRRAAVVQQAQPVAVQATDHRPAAVGPEAGGADAGHERQRLAQRAGAAQGQALTSDHVAGLGQVGAAQGIAGDDDPLVGVLRLGTGQCRQEGTSGGQRPARMKGFERQHGTRSKAPSSNAALVRGLQGLQE